MKLWDRRLGGYRIRRGASIFLSPYITQRNPRYFENPDQFMPERWDDIKIPKFAYFPFGGGAKMCIGEHFARLEGVLALASLGQKWTLERPDRSPVGIGNGLVLMPDQQIVMRPLPRVPAPVVA